jgi:hypothetical protein
MEENLSAIIFYGVAEYCDYANKLTIKLQGNKIRVELWQSSKSEELAVNDYEFLSNGKALKAYKMKIGEAILGGWKILNALPKRETWETKRSK